MKLQVYERNVYGRQTIYPTGDHARTITTLLRQKTVDLGTLAMLTRLGLTIEFVPDPESALARYTQHALTT
jgi:hypothetical protein